MISALSRWCNMSPFPCWEILKIRRIQRKMLKQTAFSFSLILVGVLTCNASFAPAAKAQGGPQKIGYVDKKRVYEKYPRLQKAATDIKDDEEKLHKLIEKNNKEFQAAQKAKKPQPELQAMHKKLQSQIDEEFKKFQDKAMGMEKDLEKELDDAIKAEAKTKNCDTVLDKSVVMFGGTDITDGVVQRLGSNATATK